MASASWHLGVDTGGTFTDAVAIDPSGRARRAKVLSTGAIRVEAREGGEDRIVCERLHGYAEGMFVGWRASRGGVARGVVASGPRRAGAERGAELALDAPLPGAGPVELSPGLPAPLVAARLLAGAPIREPLPAMRVRLATTRGTNALLEGRVSRVAMFLNEGLEDLLRIGTQQRAELFSLRVRGADPLHERTIGVRGRLDASGIEVEPLDLASVEHDARDALAEGIDRAAIALIHAWSNPAPEARLADHLRAMGFAHVSCSSEMSRTMGLIERATTAMVDAALSGPIAEFLRAIERGLAPGSTLEVITSAGSIVDAGAFRPKDSLLSGPAAGVLGASAHDPGRGVITLDMGGTSTDVARRAPGLDAPDLAYEVRVGRAAIGSPGVGVESVAAGGGSIVSIRRGEWCVGPESAGADPGPACYGRGGPLCVTDADVLLGRIDPARFEVPLRVEDARARLADLMRGLEAAARPREDDLLGAIVSIADEHMAEAIRGVSIRRGHDVGEHTLVAFGGAGPQHACAIAERLRMSRVVVPGDASVLSAAGLTLARRTLARERQVLQSLDEATARSIADEMLREIHASHDATIEVRYGVRVEGHASALEVATAHGDRGAGTIADEFRRRYREVFAHEAPDRPLELEWVRVRLRERAAWPGLPGPEPGGRPRPRAGEPGRRPWRVWHDGRWLDARVLDREGLAPGEIVAGPSLIADERTCVFVAPGWRARLGEGLGEIVVERVEPAGVGERLGAGRGEILAARLASIARDMGEQLRRTAVSTNVKDRLDFSCAVLDAEGRLVVNAPHVPVHLGSLGMCVRAVAGAIDLGPGDVAITNHPRFGGSHLPDITVVTPCHDDEGRLIAHVASRAHHAEIGGTRPGSMPPDASSLEDEGVVIAPMRVIRAGESNLDQAAGVLAGARHPSRAIADNLADVRAAIAANERGRVELVAFARAHSREALDQTMARTRERSAALAREALARRPGRFHAVERLDDGAPLSATITIGADDPGPGARACFDFSGSAPVHRASFNATPAIVRSVVLYVMRLLVDEVVPLNEGLLDPVSIVIPRGILDPGFEGEPSDCPPVAAGNTETSQRLVDVLVRALGLAGASQGTMNNLLFGNERVSFYETIAGGCGAGPGFDGASGVHSHMTNTRITDPEILERRFPVRLITHAIRRGSGGEGKFRGGDGVVRELLFLDRVRASILAQRRATGPFGLAGGSPGRPGAQWVVRGETRAPISGVASVDLEPGDRLRVETPGGGGFGPPDKP